MAIVPDDKDWTWVLEEACGECGFDPAAAQFAEIPRLIRHNIKAWLAFFESRSADELTTRPDDSTWSQLEYAAHVRDVYRIMLARLNLMLVLDDPEFLNWDQDSTAVNAKYNAQDPEVVQRQLIRAGTAFASAVEDVPLKEVARKGFRSNGSVFTVRTLAIYALHDPVHHLWDVTGQTFAP